MVEYNVYCMQLRLHVHGWETGVNSTLHYFTGLPEIAITYCIRYVARGLVGTGVIARFAALRGRALSADRCKLVLYRL